MSAPDEYRSFAAIIAEKAEAHPAKPYVIAVDQDRTVTYGELGALTRRIARFLAARGIGANDRVLLLADNTWQGMALYLGVLARGATVCTPNVEMNAAHLAEIARALDPKLVLSQDDLALDHLRGGVEWHGFGAFLASIAALPDEPLPPVNGRHDHAVIFYTSGTVAKPKGVIYTHETLWCNFDAVAEMVGLGADDRILDFRSHSWISAQEMGLGGPLTRGATIVMARRFSATRYFEWVRTHRVNIGVCVPTGINMLLNRPHPARAADLPYLRFMTSSSAPLLVEQWRAFEALYGIPVAQGYGASECGWIAGAHGCNYRHGTAGRPLKYQDVRIVDNEGRRLAPATEGEIETGGPQRALGYLLADGTIEPLPGRMRTGDIGFIDADGFLHVTGRVKDLIVRGGVNIAPVEIDGVLHDHPAVAEACTLGIPDPIWGEEVVAFVALKADTPCTAAEILAHCAAKLPEFKAPKMIRFRAALPKTSRGKLDRVALVAEWKETT